MRALECRNGHLCFSAAERPDGECPECGDESFSLVTVKEATEEETKMLVGKVVTAIDGSVVAIHKKRGTGYTTVVHGHGDTATVTTEAGSKYLVHADAIEFLSERE